ncbi:SdiA-regulated domain-containing protein [Roseivirga pacifica]|uniref:SdiA-regulated domain-containing protein n=1 Tax=Roseivirga pacifica TaxID=1267423 RepID=UPI003BB001D7
MRKLTLLVTFILLSTVLFAQAQIGEKPPYDFESPDQIYVLPDYLEEVSALTYYQPNQLAMLNDEHGRMYVYDLSKMEIVHRVRFHGDGDFEGIERVGDFIYAIESTGKMHRFNIYMEGVVEAIKTPFDKKNNVEGLGYDHVNNRLLIGLKGSGDVKNIDVKGKAVYSFDLATDEFDKLPAYVILNKDLERVVGDDFRFSPSGVAVHPLTGEVYVLSAVKNALIIFSNEGKPKNLTRLGKRLFPQPEGLTFSPNGDLFISNEIDSDGGTILKFSQKN